MAKRKKSANAVHAEAGMYMNDEQRKQHMELMIARRTEGFQREQQFAKINQMKIQSQWRGILKTAKSEQLKNELEVLKQVTERQIIRKDDLVQASVKTLQEADDQYSTAYQSHLQNVDTLIDMQNHRLQALEMHYDMDVKDLDTEFSTESAKVQVMHVKEKSNLLGVVYRINSEFTDSDADAVHEYQSGKDDIKNKNVEETHAMRIQLESVIDDLWHQFQNALSNYSLATDDRKKLFEDLKMKDMASAQVIETQLRKLAKLVDQVSQLKGKLATNAKSNERKVIELKSAKEQTVMQFQALKRKMNANRDLEKQDQIKLTLLANQVIKDLEWHVDLAEKIIKLGNMNSKLETDDEKLVWAMHCDTLSAINTKTDQPDPETFDLPDSATTTSPLPKDSNDHTIVTVFQKRYNKVLLDKLALDVKRQKLLHENNSLRAVLQAYLDGISVKENIMESDNPLLVVNGRANIIVPKREPKLVPVVDGGMSYKNSMQARSFKLSA